MFSADKAFSPTKFATKTPSTIWYSDMKISMIVVGKVNWISDQALSLIHI